MEETPSLADESLMETKPKWVLEGTYEGPYGKRYQFRSAEEIAPGYYDHIEVGAKYFWGNGMDKDPDYQHPDEIRTEEDLCSLFAQYEQFTDKELEL